jgi:hypothetical protein
MVVIFLVYCYNSIPNKKQRTMKTKFKPIYYPKQFIPELYVDHNGHVIDEHPELWVVNGFICWVDVLSIIDDKIPQILVKIQDQIYAVDAHFLINDNQTIQEFNELMFEFTNKFVEI